MRPNPFFIISNRSRTLQQEFKWRELEEQRKAERLHKRLQQEQAYLLSLQHKSKQQTGDKVPDYSKHPQTSTLPPDRILCTTPQAQVLDSVSYESSSAPHTVPPNTKSQTVALERTDSDETCPSPTRAQTEPPIDTDPPQTESVESDRPAEAVDHPPLPVREVNLLLSSACSFQLMLACLCTASVTEDRAQAHSSLLHLAFSLLSSSAVTHLLNSKLVCQNDTILNDTRGGV